jgi:hypothetical protein
MRKSVDEKRYPNKYPEQRNRHKDRAYDNDKRVKAPDDGRKNRKYSSSSHSDSSSSRPQMNKPRSSSFKGDDRRY